jgi:hypothetical protein
MKQLFVLLICITFTSPALAKKGGSSHSHSSRSHSYSKSHGSSKTTNVHGYTKKNGTYVAPHKRTSPNGTQRDNWTSKPNQNPYTGKDGTKEPQR